MISDRTSLKRCKCFRKWGLAGLTFLWILSTPARAPADSCMQNMWSNGDVQGLRVFPNWNLVHVGSFDIWLWEGGSPENIKGVTIVNFGSASAANFDSVYWQVECGKADSGLYTMAYAGVYVGSGSYPAWTWAGTSIDLSGCPDLCGAPSCGAYFTLNVYVDINDCPDNLATISMGFPIDLFGVGSIHDDAGAGCEMPWVDTGGPLHTILYTYKVGSAQLVAPGDTVTYTIFYGRPGTGSLSNIEIMDTLPPFTHYVAGSAVPALDVSWDPGGPPPVLRWTIPGPLLTTGGPTGEVRFSVSVDWGNMDWFEENSGDIAAPEGERLENTAHVFFNGTDCPVGKKSMVNPPVTTVVRRFLFWKIGDNDVLFSPTLGQPPDEMIYEIFLKNMSGTKTWWNVQLWDTVPPELDAWCLGCGFYDPCVGWTMTPTGCAAAAPGKLVAGGNTLLTWQLNMPPGATLMLRWKAKVDPTTGVAGLSGQSLMST